MSSLTETAYYSRKAIKYGGLLVVVLIVGRFVLANAYNLYLIINPPKEAAPTYGFGVLPDVEYPKATARELTYRLETPSGGFPTFPDRATVYKVISERPNLLALERSSEEVQSLGFEESPEQISELSFRWRYNEPVATTLDMNIFRGTFTFKVDWASKNEFLTEKQLPTEEKAVKNVKDTLKDMKLLTDDLKTAEQKVSFLKAFGRELKPTVSLSEADFIQVDIFRANIDGEYATVTPDPTKGVIRGIVSGNTRFGDIIYLEYNYYPASYERGETYPLITASVAWNKLQQGEGYVARLNSGVDQATVRRVGLGYYDTYEPQSYLQPVFVFTGDDNFVAYVSAIAELEE